MYLRRSIIVKSIIDRIRYTEDTEVVPVLRLEIIYSHTTRLLNADPEDPTPYSISEEPGKH